MKEWRYGEVKNKALKYLRGKCFDDLDPDKVMRIDLNSKRPNQEKMFVLIDEYIWVVPFINT